MKKIIFFVLVISLILSSSITAFAVDTKENYTSQGNLFASKETYESITGNLNINQIKTFLGHDRTLDLQYLVPVYMPTGDFNNDSLYAMLEFANMYNALVYYSDGSFCGTATLSYREDKWGIRAIYIGYNMLDEIGELSSNEQAYYYIDNFFTHEHALLEVTEDAEIYRSLTTPDGIKDVNSVLETIHETILYYKDHPDSEGGGGLPS